MEKDKLAVHSRAVNLARRYTEMNENDLVMENLFDDESSGFSSKKTFTKQDCMEMARHMIHESALPSQCKKYNDVLVDLRRRDSDTTHPTQYLS